MMRVMDLMSSPPITVEADRPLKEVAEVLLHHGVSSVPVDASGRVVGILSETDLLDIESRRHVTRRADGYGEAKVASDVMTKAVIATSPEVQVDDLIRLMTEHRVKRVPVVGDGRLVGVISRTDVIRMLTRADEDIAREVTEVMRNDGLLIDPIRFDVRQGVVTFWGVTAPALRAHLAAAAHEIPGVIAVDVSLEAPDTRPPDHRENHPRLEAG